MTFLLHIRFQSPIGPIVAKQVPRSFSDRGKAGARLLFSEVQTAEHEYTQCTSLFSLRRPILPTENTHHLNANCMLVSEPLGLEDKEM